MSRRLPNFRSAFIGATMLAAMAMPAYAQSGTPDTGGKEPPKPVVVADAGGKKDDAPKPSAKKPSTEKPSVKRAANDAARGEADAAGTDPKTKGAGAKKPGEPDAEPPPPFTTVRLTNPATDYPAIKPEEAASTGVIHALYDSNNKMKERYPGHFVVVNYIEEAVDPARVPEAGRDELADSQAQTALIKKALEALADRSNKPITYLEVVVGRYDAEGRYTSLYIPALSHALSHGNMLGPNGTDVEYVPGRHDPETPYAEVHVEGRHVYSTAWGQYAATVPLKDRQRAVAGDLFTLVNRSNSGYYASATAGAVAANIPQLAKADGRDAPVPEPNQ